MSISTKLPKLPMPGRRATPSTTVSKVLFASPKLFPFVNSSTSLKYPVYSIYSVANQPKPPTGSATINPTSPARPMLPIMKSPQSIRVKSS